jgi:hypothetical protein
LASEDIARLDGYSFASALSKNSGTVAIISELDLVHWVHQQRPVVFTIASERVEKDDANFHVGFQSVRELD